MAKRQYNKKSEYWDKFDKKEENSNDLSLLLNKGNKKEKWEPSLSGEPIYISNAASYSRVHNSSGVTTRSNRAANGFKQDKYKNIDEGMLPFEYSRDGVSIQYAIELCQKAYANIAIFRNSIDMMSDFTNSELELIGGNETSRGFIEAWLKRINIWDVKDQFFREYYKTSNIFYYVIDGKLHEDDFVNFRKVGLRAMSNKLPLKYILLNPRDITSDDTVLFEGNFAKILSKFELETLQNPKTDKDLHLFESLPEDVRNKIKNNQFEANGLRIPLDRSKLRYCFYKKQDYEPMAIPFGYAVLDDLNMKLEYKKIDQAIVRTIENVVLLITMGNEPDKGGVVPDNMIAMQQLFKNESIGRVLVSDYTTKADFIIPDLKKVLGPEKYEIVNQDIKEGLQNIIISQEKFSNTSVKAELFLQRLQEGRQAFLNNFLQPEIDQICKNFGFKQVPEARFETIDLSDKTEMHRVITRMMELGVLPPEEGIEVIETGLFPEKDKLREAQKRYAKDREDGLYNPLVGGVPVIPPAENPETGNQANPASSNQTPKSAGRPGAGTSKASYSVDNIVDITKKTQDFYLDLEKEAKVIYAKKKLTKSQKETLRKVALQVVKSESIENWLSEAVACLKDPKLLLKMKTLNGVVDISLSHNLDEYSSSLLFHSAEIEK